MTAAVDRGERYADGGFDPHDARYPDPATIARCHAEWPDTSPRTHVRPGRLGGYTSAPRAAQTAGVRDRKPVKEAPMSAHDSTPVNMRSTSVTRTERRRFYNHHGIAPGTSTNVSCSYCGATGMVHRPTATNFYSSNMEIDHVVPRHLGGALDVSNLTWACTGCNRRKGHHADWTSPNSALINGEWVVR